MVSFSCDKCQNVFTKPKVLRHLSSCRTDTVSCIDCGIVFDKRSVRAHKSCISEAEKYAPKNKTSTECTPTFCGICKLALNGAVHSLQHYESKKHRAAERRLKEAEKEEKKKSQPTPFGTEINNKMSISENQDGRLLLGEGVESRDGETKRRRALGVKKAMRKALKAAPKKRLKRDHLVRAVQALLGKECPPNLSEVVDKKAGTSGRFVVKKGRVGLIQAAD